MSNLVRALRDEAENARNWLNVRELLKAAANEIERLTLLAGAVSNGPSLADIKQKLKSETHDDNAGVPHA